MGAHLSDDALTMAWSVALCRRSSSVPATAKAIPRGDAWLQEPKLDGYRLQVKLNSRNSHEWTQRLAALAEALQAIPRRSVVLDAELCFAGADGAPNFKGLRSALGPGRKGELTAFAFAILHRDGTI